MQDSKLSQMLVLFYLCEQQDYYQRVPISSISYRIFLRKSTQVCVIVSRSQIDRAAYFIVILTAITERIIIKGIMGILCTEAAIVVTFRLTACGIRQNYHISVCIEMIVCLIAIFICIYEIDTTEVSLYVISIDIRYDIRAVPQVDFASDTMTKPIGAIN